MKPTIAAIFRFLPLTWVVVVCLSSCAHKAAPTAYVRPYPKAIRPISSSGTFKKGDSIATVRGVMGEPELQRDTGELTVWNYKFSTITFAKGRVTTWNNYNRNLKVKEPGEEADTEVAGNEGQSGTEAGLVAPDGLLNESGVSQNTSGQSNSSMQSGRSYGQTNPSIQRVSSYQRTDGTTVPSYIRTRADTRTGNNFSAPGNYNPNSGRRGNR